MFTRFLDTGFLRAMADAGPAMNWISDDQGACTYFNNTWLEFTGRTLDQEVGRGWIDGVHPGDRKRWLAVQDSFLIRRKAYRLEFRLRRHDGAYRRILHFGIPMYAPDGTFTGYFGNSIDVTDGSGTVNPAQQPYGSSDDVWAWMNTPLSKHSIRDAPESRMDGARHLDDSENRPVAAVSKECLTRVLIVDDHPMLRAQFRKLLESEPGFEVVGEAKNGAEAVTLARSLRPDVVLMDFNMPVMNGLEATRRIKAELPDTAIIALSMSVEEGIARAMCDAGAACYLKKDVAFDEVLDAIRRMQSCR